MTIKSSLPLHHCPPSPTPPVLAPLPYSLSSSCVMKDTVLKCIHSNCSPPLLLLPSLERREGCDPSPRHERGEEATV